ncbi:MAG: hypothetical protein N3H30_00995 [Candidatus Micrarchaeota archaeon]|nr:hypothetical protein [Candidatus Micrarchaeota archaeon]
MLALLIISCAAHAADDSVSLELAGKGWLSDLIYNGAIPIALVISYSIIALAYMASKVFMSHELGAWSMVELREALVSTLYACLILALIPPMNALIESLGGTEGFTEISNRIIERAITKISVLVGQTSAFSFLQIAGWSPSAGYPLHEAGIDMIYLMLFYNPFMVLYLFNQFTNAMLPIMFSAVISIVGQFVLLRFLEQSLYILVGLGLLLRAFTFTRRMGSTVIAIFLGGFIFLKLALSIEAAIFANMPVTDKDVLLPDKMIDPFGMPGLMISTLGIYFLEDYYALLLTFCTALTFISCSAAGPWFLVCWSSVYPFCQFVIYPIVHLITYMVTVAAIVLNLIGAIVTLLTAMGIGIAALGGGPIIAADMVSDLITEQIAVNSDIMALAFFMPLFNIVFVLAGVKALVEAMGGDEAVVHMLTFI